MRSVVLIRWDNSRIWRFNVLTDQNSDNSNYKELINSVLNFHKLSKEEKIMALPRKINIHVANRGDTLSSLAERMSLEKNSFDGLKMRQQNSNVSIIKQIIKILWNSYKGIVK